MYYSFLLALLPFATALSADIVRAGNYNIEQCGNQAGVVKASLIDTSNFLQRIIRAEDGHSAPYKAFLSGVDVAETKALFLRIAAGKSIITPARNYRPVIVCILRPSDQYWEACHRNPELAGFHMRNTHFVFLCPFFFTRMNPWPLNRDCNVVTSRKGLSGPDLHVTRYTHLVHELVHLYLGKPGLTPEVYDATACLRLPPAKAAINPNNYALYAGSEYTGLPCAIAFTYSVPISSLNLFKTVSLKDLLTPSP